MWTWILIGAVVFVAAVALYDITQKRHTILRTFPVVGHFRYLLESVGPELRQYIVSNNNEERPFSRSQRRWVYASSKRQNNYFAFGTDEVVEGVPGYPVIKHAAVPASHPHRWHGESEPTPLFRIPSAKILGRARGRARAFRPASTVNISGMSHGSLSAAAVEAMNRGSAIADCLHNTGEGGIGAAHQHGGELIWQIGTGYFGCRTPDGRFDLIRFMEQVERHPVRAIEIKLSQGAKPGMGGLLPGSKVTAEIARIRGVPEGKDCISPSSHAEFTCPDSMLDFVERLAQESGLPVGVKAAVGGLEFWEELTRLMSRRDRGVDFVTVDGGEGGTGAAPLVFTDHVALPFKLAFSRLYPVFARAGLHEEVSFFGSGKLGFPDSAFLAFAMGCDGVNVAREAMLAVGCIQAQRCHTGHCPAGVATQNKWLMRGLDPTDKSVRLANYVVQLRKELLWLSRACGVHHPGLVTGDHVEILDGALGSQSLYDVFGYDRSWGLPSADDRAEVERLMGAPAESENREGPVRSGGLEPGAGDEAAA